MSDWAVVIIEILIAEKVRQPLTLFLELLRCPNTLCIKIKSSIKKAIATPLGMLKGLGIDASSGRDDGISGVCSDSEDPRSAAIVKDDAGRSVAKSVGDYSLEFKP